MFFTAFERPFEPAEGLFQRHGGHGAQRQRRGMEIREMRERKQQELLLQAFSYQLSVVSFDLQGETDQGIKG